MILEELIASIFRRPHVPPKRQLTFDGLLGVIAQKIELFT
jgi:hypothetical protein